MKIVLVTGGSRGIGSEIAKRYAKRPDTTVLINFQKDEKGALSTAREISDAGGKASIYQADVSSPPEVRMMAEKINNDFDGAPLSTLINNAGQIIRPSGWSEATDEDIERTIQVNLMSVLWTTRTFAPKMLSFGGGHIVNMTTTYAINGAAPVLAYTAAKAGVRTITTALAAEFGASGVRVNAIAPGNIWTRMTEESGDDVNEWAVTTTPLSRLGNVQDVADAVDYLENASFVTGHTISIDGGQILKI